MAGVARASSVVPEEPVSSGAMPPQPSLMYRSIVLLIISLAALPVAAQHEGVLHPRDPLHGFLLRQQVTGDLQGILLQHLPLSRYEARAYLTRIDRSRLNSLDRSLLRSYVGEQPPGAELAQQLWSQFYDGGASFLSVEGEGFRFELDPLLYLQAGRVMRPGADTLHRSTFQNTRGIRAAGHIGPYFFFETRLEENQRRDAWPSVALRSAPRLGGTKFYRESQEYDYWRAMGVVGIRTNHFEVRAGRDRNRWGDGVTSLFLSDYAPEYDQLQIRTTVWRFQYVNLFTAWTDVASLDRFNDHVMPRKYGALHSLAIDLPARVQLHFYESVIFAPDYDDNRRRGFDLSYLNPLIFYRAVEIDRGSPDNMQIGAGASWIPVPGLKLFAQGLLTEFKLDELTSGEGWFGNKWGWTGGFHAVPPWVPGMDVRFEHTRVRPFTYSHRDVETTFVHYNDPLGHPAEQNFYDYALQINYQPHVRWSGTLNASYTRRGRNPEGENWGGDPRESYATRLQNHGHFIGQGVRVNEYRLEAHAGYELLPRVYLEVAAYMEQIDDAELGTEWYVNPMLQLRWGLPFQGMRY